MNKKLEQFADISEDLCLTISREKCLRILFGSNLLEERHPIFKIRGTKVPVKKSITYLGFTLDSKLNWIEHFENVREKIRNFTSNIKKVNKRDMGLSTIYKKVWYETVIEKQILYGLEVWGDGLHSHSIRKIKSCQRLGLRSIITTYRTVSTDALCVITGVTPIMIRVNNLISRYNVYCIETPFLT